MKKYSDYPDNNLPNDIWTKFKIVVPTEQDRKYLMEAFEHIHYSDIDTEFVTVNQLAHQYLDDNFIIINEDLYKTLP